jgi:hypothetical protein
MKKKFLAGAIIMVLGMTAIGHSENSGVSAKKILKRLQTDITAGFKTLDTESANTAKQLAKIEFKSKEARDKLLSICKRGAWIADCSIVDAAGIMVVVEPKSFADFEGSNISKQKHIMRMHKTKKPVMSSVFRSVEGFDAIDIEHPILSKPGVLKGSVSILLKPEEFLTGIAANASQGKEGHRIIVTQKDGLVLYDSVLGGTGKNLFTDSVYSSSVQGVKKIAEKKRGNIKPATAWDTVSLYGAEWRVIAINTSTAK